VNHLVFEVVVEGAEPGRVQSEAEPLFGFEQLGLGPALLGEVVEGLTALPTLAPHPVAARRRAFLRRLRGLMTWWIPATVGWVVLITVRAGGADLWLPTVVVWAFDLSDDVRVVPLVVVVTGFVLAWLFAVAEHRALAHGHDDHVLAARQGPLARTLSIAPLMRLQAVTFQQSVLQARRGLATVVAHVAGPGGDVTVLDAGVSAAHHLRDTLAAAAAGTPTAAAAQGTDGTGGIADGTDGVVTVSARS
jgi:putative membrane protein